MLRFSLLSVFVLLISFRIFSQNLIDITLADNGISPDITMDREGSIHISFGNSSGIFYRSFNSSGIALREPKLIVSKGSYYSNLSLSSSSLALINGQVMALWTDKQLMIFNAYIHGRLYDTRNDSLYNIIPINSSYGDAIRANPTIIALNDTAFFALWEGNGPETPISFGIYGNIFSSKIKRSDEDILISDIKDSKVNAGNAVITIKPDGSGFWVFWRDNRTGTYKVYARELSADGTPNGNSFLVSEDPKLKDLWFLHAAIGSSGNFAVVWGGEFESIGWQIQLRRFDKSGVPLGASNYVTSKQGDSGYTPAVAAAYDSSGNSVVAWDQSESNGSLKIYAQRFSSENKPIGQTFRVSKAADDVSQILPVLRMRDGNIYCFWSEIQDTTEKVKLSILDFNNPVLSVDADEEESIASEFALLQNYPNPFNPTTTISYSIPERANVELRIYDIMGNEIKVYTFHSQASGHHSLKWDGRNSNKQPVSSGTYICRLRAVSYEDGKVFEKSAKMVLVK